jgi:hypothetical protein
MQGWDVRHAIANALKGFARDLILNEHQTVDSIVESIKDLCSLTGDAMAGDQSAIQEIRDMDH